VAIDGESIHVVYSFEGAYEDIGSVRRQVGVQGIAGDKVAIHDYRHAVAAAGRVGLPIVLVLSIEGNAAAETTDPSVDAVASGREGIALIGKPPTKDAPGGMGAEILILDLEFGVRLRAKADFGEVLSVA